MQFDYYLVVKKEKKRGKILVFKREDRTDLIKYIPMFDGAQKGTLYQSIHEAEFARKVYGIWDDTYIQKITVEIDPTTW